MSEEILELATEYYRIGVLQNDKKSLLVACSKLLEISTDYFETNAPCYHLWGNILVSLGAITSDESFFEQGIRKYDAAIQIADDQDLKKEIVWDVAEAYILLGKKSKESSDFKKALNAYEKASFLGANLPHFWLDFGEALFLYGISLNQSEFIKKAIVFFKKVIADTTPIEDQLRASPEKAYERAWFLYAHAHYGLLELYWTKEAFENAEKAFQQALLNIPHETTLWLSWGKMALEYGYVKKDLDLIDRALEKLTAHKLEDSDGMAHALLLARGIIILGIFLDDLRLLKEGQKRVMQLGSGIDVDFVQAMAFFALGVHFNDQDHYLKAFEKWEKVKKSDPKNVIVQYMLYETQMALYELTKDQHWLLKSLKSCSYICKSRPESTLFHIDLGICYLKWSQSDQKHPLALELALESFKKIKEDDLRALFHHGLTLDALGFDLQDTDLLEEAILKFEKVFNKLPSSLNVHHQLGLTYYHLGFLSRKRQQLETAISFFEVVIKQDREDDIAFCNLGKAKLKLYEVTGEDEEREMAYQAFREALRLGNKESSSFLQGGLLS